MTGAPLPCRRRRGGDGRAHAPRRRPRHHRPHRRTRPVHQSARLRGAAGETVLHRRQAPRLHRYRYAGRVRAHRRRRFFAGPPWPSSPPATKSSKFTNPRAIFRFAIPTPGRWPPRSRAPAACPKYYPSPATPSQHTRESIARGLQGDLLLLSGGVSAGKVRRGGGSAAGFRRRILFRPRADPARPAAGLRPRRAENSSSACPGILPRPW